MIPVQTLWLIHWSFYQYVKDILILFWTLKGRTRLKFTWILDLNLLWHYMGCGNSFEGAKDSRLSQLERVDADTSDYFIEPKLLLIWCWTILGIAFIWVQGFYGIWLSFNYELIFFPYLMQFGSVFKGPHEKSFRGGLMNVILCWNFLMSRC